MKFQKTQGPSGPSSALGITRFFDTESPGPKMSPEFVIIAVAVVTAAFIVLHLIS